MASEPVELTVVTAEVPKQDQVRRGASSPSLRKFMPRLRFVGLLYGVVALTLIVYASESSLSAGIVVAVLLAAVGFIGWKRYRELHPATIPPPAPNTPAPPPAPEFKKCPHCAEAIRYEAVLCRFCQKEVVGDHVPAGDPSPNPVPAVPSRTSHEFRQLLSGVGVVLLLIGGFYALRGRSTVIDAVSPVDPPVPRVELSQGGEYVARFHGLTFSDWRWDGIYLKGKVMYNPQSAEKLDFRPPFPLDRQLSGCECYGKDGTKLLDGAVTAPGSIMAGQTAEVSIIISDREKVGRVVIHLH